MTISFIYPQLLWLLLLLPIKVVLALLGPRRPNLRRFWIGLVLRSILLTATILAVAGIQLQLRTDLLTTVFVLDVSDSVPADEQSRAENLIRAAVQEMPSGDRAAVVLFGEDALVERLATEENALNDLTSVPISTRTDIASALQLALALFPNEGGKRIVLLSDGQENLGYALEQAELIALHQVELLYMPLSSPDTEVEVLIESMDAPAEVREGEQIQLEINIRSTANVDAALQVFGDGQLIHSRNVTLETGENQYLIPVEAEETGFKRFRAQITPVVDARLQNNEASAFVVVFGPPRVLVVEGQSGEANNLVAALATTEMEVRVTAPAGMPATLQELANYDAVVLANAAAWALPPGVLDALQIFVRDLGKGLIMTGGTESFGAGGYLRSPLEDVMPVDFDVRSKEMMANLALILTIDKSGSMGRCHCDDPDLNQSYTRQEVGQPKVDIAKEAVMRAASALSQEDYLGVVAFDEAAAWALDANKLPDYTMIEQSIGGITANGQTNVGAGVIEAYEALESIDAKRKHVILLTDGWTHSGDLTSLVEEMQASGITLSIIAAGGGSAEYLEALAESGGGRYYPAQDILSVPDLFLKETVTSVGEYIIEEAFYPLPSIPGPALRGLDTLTLPAVLGYNGTTPKTTARLDLLTPRGDPLLATWQYGLGRSAAWTTDLKGQWGTHWVNWDGFTRFASQLVGWVLPAPQQEGLSAQATVANNTASIELTAQDENGQPINFLQAQAMVISPELESQEVTLEQIGPGQYSASFEATQPGTYLIRVGANDADLQTLGQQTLGLVVPYSPEYKASGVDLARLIELAQITGGGELASPLDAFLHNLPTAAFAKEIWRPILIAVALLFPFDVAIRRLVFGQKEVQDAKGWLAERLRPARTTPAKDAPKVLGNLFEARDRARSRRVESEEEGSPPKPSPVSQSRPAEKPTAPPKEENLPPQDDQDTFSRLRDAKRRARKRDD
jgi:Mg-chelatase subunit ChlD